MELDTERIDDTVLALLHLTSFNEGPTTRAWKGHDWDAMDRLHQKGYISDPKNKNKSVVMSEEGQRRSEQVCQKLVGK